MRFNHDPINFKMMPPVIKGLIIANTAVFVLSQIVGPGFYNLFGLVPGKVVGDFWIWQMVTYLFIHGGFFHLLFNLFALWMFGMPVEAQWGGREFLKYYLICGLGAAAASIVLATPSTEMIPVIGASGPVYGMLVAFAMLYPDSVIYLYFLFPVKAKHMAIIFGLIEFFAGASGSTPGIARFAHLGGMVTGYLYIRWWWVIKIRAKAVWTDVQERRPQRSSPRPPRRSETRRGALETDVEDPMTEVDRILDKILVSGLDSLSEEERRIMKRYSDKTQ